MKIKCYNHLDLATEHEIGDVSNEVAFLLVTVMTGDEIIEVYHCDMAWGDAYLVERIDPMASDRTREFLDATYIVYPDEIEKWNERTNSYYYRRINKDERLKGIYINVRN